MLSLEFLKSILHYNPDTGLWTYLVDRGRNARKGGVAGSKTHDGYIRLLVKRKQYLSHRLAVFYMTGEWPKALIDHKDTIKDNNKWDNLREATSSQNGQNKTVTVRNITKAKGVSKSKNGKFRVYLCLGSYNTVEEAKAVYDKAAKEVYGEFYRA